jgi:hypothetical protein
MQQQHAREAVQFPGSSRPIFHRHQHPVIDGQRFQLVEDDLLAAVGGKFSYFCVFDLVPFL